MMLKAIFLASTLMATPALAQDMKPAETRQDKHEAPLPAPDQPPEDDAAPATQPKKPAEGVPAEPAPSPNPRPATEASQPTPSTAPQSPSQQPTNDPPAPPPEPR